MPPSELNIRRRNLSLPARRIEKKLGLNRPFTKQDVDVIDTELKRVVDEWAKIRGDILTVLQKRSP